MAWNAASSSTSPSRSSLSVTAGGSPMRSQSTSDIIAQVAREKVVETLQQEVGAARREGLFASSELAEVREACRAENQRYQQETQRLSSRLKSQKARIDEVVHLEGQARRMLAIETEEKTRLEIKLLGVDHRHEEQRTSELRGARAQLGKLQQRCREAEEAQAGLQQSCARELGAVEAMEGKAAKRQQILELQEQELSKRGIACEKSQAALEASKREAVALSKRLASVEDVSAKTMQEHLRSQDEVSDVEARASQATARAEEEAQRCAELRFELLHALHHELPSERSRVSELETRERAEADRIRSVCEAEVSDLPPNLVEKVQSAIRRHEAWWFQWSHSQSASPSGKKDSGSSNQRPHGGCPAIIGMPDAGNTLTSATTRYEAVLGALAQCAGASARENMELRARLAGTWNSEEELPPEVQKQLTTMKREIVKVREENHELKLQRHVQEDAVTRLKKDLQASDSAKDVQLMNKVARRNAPNPVPGAATEHRRKVRLFEAEVQGAERQAEAAKLSLSEQESSHSESMSALQQEVSELRHKCREAGAAEKDAQRSEAQNVRLRAELSARKESLKAEASQESPSPSMTVSASQHAAVQRRLLAVHRRLQDAIPCRDQERELVHLCGRLSQEVAAERCDRRALAERYRCREATALEFESRCAELQSALQQRDDATSELERQWAADRQLLEVESLRGGGQPSRAPQDGGKTSSTRSVRKRRSADQAAELSSNASADSPSSPARAASAPPSTVDRIPVANLLNRWVTKALENENPERASIAEGDKKEKENASSVPVQMLLSRWVKKAVESEGGTPDSQAESSSKSPSAAMSTGGSPCQAAKATGGTEEASELPAEGRESLSYSKDALEDTQSPSPPRSPSGTWLTRLGIDFSSPKDIQSAANDAGSDGTGAAMTPTVTGTPTGDPAGANSGANNSPSAPSSPSESVPAAAGGTPEAKDSDGLSPSSLQGSEAAASAAATGLSSEWRGLDMNDTTGMMEWLNEVDQSLPSISTPGASRRATRLASVAEEPSGLSPPDGGPGPEEEANLEEVFQQAEALCDAQRYEEALPIFHEILNALKDDEWVQRSPSMRSLQPEVRAHLGVALQSLGRVEEAIEAYSSAVQRDPSLHVCQANLAQLHAYLEDPVRARMHLNAALRLDPTNLMYTQLDEQFRASETAGTLRM